MVATITIYISYIHVWTGTTLQHTGMLNKEREIISTNIKKLHLINNYGKVKTLFV